MSKPEYHPKKIRTIEKAVEDYAYKAYSDGYDDGIREIEFILRTSYSNEEIVTRLRTLVDNVEMSRGKDL